MCKHSVMSIWNEGSCVYNGLQSGSNCQNFRRKVRPTLTRRGNVFMKPDSAAQTGIRVATLLGYLLTTATQINRLIVRLNSSFSLPENPVAYVSGRSVGWFTSEAGRLTHIVWLSVWLRRGSTRGSGVSVLYPMTTPSLIWAGNNRQETPN